MDIAIDQDRLAKLTLLRNGSHSPNDGDLICVMEAVAWVAHEPWSDAPHCVCPVIGAFMRSWNDGIADDDTRTRLLKPLIPRLINTRSTPEIEQRRAAMAADWLIRVYTPAWLRLAKLDKQADALAGLPEIADLAQCPSVIPTLTAVGQDAAAAGDAAWTAAWATARAAAGDAAWDAAWTAAWAAARAAAGVAAGDALSKTTSELQQSALALVERMIELTEAA